MSQLQGDCVLLGLWLCRRVNGGEDGVSQVIWSRRRLDTRRGFGLGGRNRNIPNVWFWRVYHKHPGWLRRVCRKHSAGLADVPETSHGKVWWSPQNRHPSGFSGFPKTGGDGDSKAACGGIRKIASSRSKRPTAYNHRIGPLCIFSILAPTGILV